jgi:uncharacterized membrane protein YgcG
MNNHEIDNELRTRLEEIKSVPPRDLGKTRQGRARFLNEALQIEATVSAGRFFRHSRWIPIEKEKLVMNIVISMLVIAGLLFGGGATVSAAQDDLPGQALYAVKTASEDFRLQLMSDPQEEALYLMELTQARLQEMAAITNAGQSPSDALVTRLELHIHQALQTCTQMDEAGLDQTLLQIRDQLRQQDRDMEQLQLHASPEAQLLLERTRRMLQSRLQIVEEGLLNHEQFRNTVRNGQLDTQIPPATNGDQNTEQNREQNNLQNGQPTEAPGGPNLEPGGPNTDPGGPNTDMTPAPGSSNGSGTGTGNGSGDGSGGSGYGGNGSNKP